MLNTSLRCHDNWDVNVTLIKTDFHLYLIKTTQEILKHGLYYSWKIQSSHLYLPIIRDLWHRHKTLTSRRERQQKYFTPNNAARELTRHKSYLQTSCHTSCTSAWSEMIVLYSPWSFTLLFNYSSTILPLPQLHLGVFHQKARIPLGTLQILQNWRFLTIST